MNETEEDERLYCDCACCGRPCLGDRYREWACKQPSLPLHVAGRINGRPWCNDCLRAARPPGSRSGPSEDPSPSQQNAIRVMEGE